MVYKNIYYIRCDVENSVYYIFIIFGEFLQIMKYVNLLILITKMFSLGTKVVCNTK